MIPLDFEADPEWRQLEAELLRGVIGGNASLRHQRRREINQRMCEIELRYETAAAS